MAASEAWQANGSHKICLCMRRCALCTMCTCFNLKLRIVAARTRSRYIHTLYIHKQHVLYVSHSSTFDYLKRITNPIEILLVFFFGAFIGCLYLWVQRQAHTHSAHLLRFLSINCFNIFHHIFVEETREWPGRSACSLSLSVLYFIHSSNFIYFTWNNTWIRWEKFFRINNACKYLIVSQS